MPKIKFLTDSASDIPSGARKGLDIEVLPFTIISGDKEYKDGVNFSRQEFFKFLLSKPNIPTHSQLTVFDFCECYERLWTGGYTDVIYTSINSKASATWQNAVTATEEFYKDHPEAKAEFQIHVVDSMTYTMAYGWGVVQAARMAKAGVSAEICAAAIKDWCEHSRILFTPMDLKFAKKSGRVSAAAAFLGDALGLHPIMTFEDGESKVLTKVRGDKNVVPTMIKMCQNGMEENSPYLCIYGCNRDMNKILRHQFSESMKTKPALEYAVGGVIAINAGPNLVGVVYREK